MQRFEGGENHKTGRVVEPEIDTLELYELGLRGTSKDEKSLRITFPNLSKLYLSDHLFPYEFHTKRYMQIYRRLTLASAIFRF